MLKAVKVKECKGMAGIGRRDRQKKDRSRGGRKKATREVTSAVNNLSFKTSLRL